MIFFAVSLDHLQLFNYIIYLCLILVSWFPSIKVFVWMGPQSSDVERKMAIKSAQVLTLNYTLDYLFLSQF